MAETEDSFGSSIRSLDNPSSWGFLCELRSLRVRVISHVEARPETSILGGRQSPNIMRMDLEKAKSEYQHA